MTEPDDTALAVALAYYRAWSSYDFERAMTDVADGVVCKANMGNWWVRGPLGVHGSVHTDRHTLGTHGRIR